MKASTSNRIAGPLPSPSIRGLTQRAQLGLAVFEQPQSRFVPILGTERRC